jgi:hypothetical protein
MEGVAAALPMKERLISLRRLEKQESLGIDAGIHSDKTDV